MPPLYLVLLSVSFSSLNWLKSGKNAFSEIQHPFVWDISKVRDLMGSPYQGYSVVALLPGEHPMNFRSNIGRNPILNIL